MGPLCAAKCPKCRLDCVYIAGLSIVYCLLFIISPRKAVSVCAPRARCVVVVDSIDSPRPKELLSSGMERGVADREVIGSHMHAWEWQAGFRGLVVGWWLVIVRLYK
jgi:hypothetical protein